VGTGDESSSKETVPVAGGRPPGDAEIVAVYVTLPPTTTELGDDKSEVVVTAVATARGNVAVAGFVVSAGAVTTTCREYEAPGSTDWGGRTTAVEAPAVRKSALRGATELERP